MNKVLEEIKAQHSSYQNVFDNYYAYDFRQINKYFCPRRGRYLSGTSEVSKDTGAINYTTLDEAGIIALRTLAAGLFSGIHSSKWFRLGLADKDLEKYTPVKLWLDELQNRWYSLLDASNFYNAMPVFYLELAGFGTEFMFCNAHLPTRSLIFTPLTIGEYVIDTDEQNKVDTIFRRLDMSARNMVNMFGYERCSQSVQRAYDKASSRSNNFQVIHALHPYLEKDPSNFNYRNFEWSDSYYEPGSTDKFLKRGGQTEFPGVGVRWTTTGQDVYGGCPTMDVLGRSRGQQSLWNTYYELVEKEANPPTVSPRELTTPNLSPGGHNYANTLGGAPGLTPAYQVRPNHQGLREVIEYGSRMIGEALYNDLFKMLALAPKQMTATEVVERQSEKLLQLGPVFGRIQSEGLSPLFDRMFYLMNRMDLVPEWPVELDDMPLKIEFKGLLAKAHKMADVQATNQWIGTIGGLAQLDPDAVDSINVDETADSIADSLDVPRMNVRSQDEREMRRQQRQQIAAQQAQLDQAAQQIDMATQIANSDMDPESMQQAAQ